MDERALAPRLRRLPVATLLGLEVRVAAGFRARLLGLAHLDRDQVGPGLLIPRCSSAHTFGMRFPLDLYFLDRAFGVLAVQAEIPGRRAISHLGASAVLEIPAGEGGEFSPLWP